jgi:hypothetical protein
MINSETLLKYWSSVDFFKAMINIDKINACIGSIIADNVINPQSINVIICQYFITFLNLLSIIKIIEAIIKKNGKNMTSGLNSWLKYSVPKSLAIFETIKMPNN